MNRKAAIYEKVQCGGQILILGNGPSCRFFDLDRVKVPTIGLNRAWELKKCTYYCMGDSEQYRALPAFDITDPPIPIAFTIEDGPEYAVRIQGHHNDPEHPKRFSFDLNDGVHLNNTIASFGFQLAVWMLGTHGTIYTLGIDSYGPQFDGSPMPPGTWENQRETLGYIAGVLAGTRPGIQVYDLSPVSKQRVFKRKKFEEVFG